MIWTLYNKYMIILKEDKPNFSDIHRFLRPQQPFANLEMGGAEGAGEMAQRLRAVPALPNDLSSISLIDMQLATLWLPFQGESAGFFWPLQALHARCVDVNVGKTLHTWN